MQQALTDKKLGEFIRLLRLNKELKKSFIKSVEITQEQQESYMLKYGHLYYVCIDEYNNPVGFVGVVNNDLRIAVHPDHRNKGVGTFMLKYILEYFIPEIKVRKTNLNGQKFFYKHKLKYTVVD